MTSAFSVDLIVDFFLSQIPIRFMFQISAGKWSLNQVEVEDAGKATILDAIGDIPMGEFNFFL